MLIAKAFAEEFVKKANCAAKKIYSRNKEWTNITLKWIEQILYDLDKEIKVNHEYYRIDTIGWIQHKEELNTGNSNLASHLWNLIVAVEHENNSREWLDELCKLTYIRCPLRVIIGYGVENINEKIALIKEILTKTGAFTDDEQEFLIILGKHKNEFIQGGDNFTYFIITKKDIVN